MSRDTDGDGLIEITTAQQLNAMRYDLNGDGTVDDASNANDFRPLAPVGGSACPSGTTCTGYELANDIALSGSWTPIGGNVPGNSDRPHNPGGAVYTATFNGNGNTISGLRISRASSTMVGLFGAIGGDNAEVHKRVRVRRQRAGPGTGGRAGGVRPARRHRQPLLLLRLGDGQRRGGRTGGLEPGHRASGATPRPA